MLFLLPRTPCLLVLTWLDSPLPTGCGQDLWPASNQWNMAKGCDGSPTTRLRFDETAAGWHTHSRASACLLGEVLGGHGGEAHDPLRWPFGSVGNLQAVAEKELETLSPTTAKRLILPQI